mgnify:CR=1 FL=1
MFFEVTLTIIKIKNIEHTHVVLRDIGDKKKVENELNKALQKAEEITSVSPSAVRATKRVLNHMSKLDGLPESLSFSREVIGNLAKTEDFKEGVSAFVEKRKPKWVNR